MFTCHCPDYNFCFKNISIDKTKYLEDNNLHYQMNPDPSISITSLVKKNRQNEFTQFLIILGDKHYKKRFFSPSIYEYLNEIEFPGIVNIVKQSDLSNNQYIIRDHITLKKVYIKSYKENLYIDSSQYEDFLLNSITNEFLHVISVLNPSSIKIKIYNQNKNNIDFDMNTSISFQGLDIGNGVRNQNTTDTNNKKEWLLTFTKKNGSIDLSCFLDTSKFYYLPKKSEWLDLIYNRTHYNVNTANYVYEHNSDSNHNIHFLQNIKFIKIDANYKKTNNQNLRFEYEINYFPL